MIFCFFGKFPLCNRFQLGNSFGNTCVFFGKFLLCNRFQLGNSFGNTYVFFWGGKFPYVFVFN